MTSTFRAAIAAGAALAAAAIFAPGEASAAVSLEDYSFTANVTLLFFPEQIDGAFTLAHDTVADTYSLNAINFSIFNYTFNTGNSSAAKQGENVVVSGFSGDLNNHAGFSLLFDPSPVEFLSIETDVSGCNDFYCVSNEGSSRDGTIERLTTSVPEPAAWALMLLGFGGVGAGLRAARRARVVLS